MTESDVRRIVREELRKWEQARQTMEALERRKREAQEEALHRAAMRDAFGDKGQG